MTELAPTEILKRNLRVFKGNYAALANAAKATGKASDFLGLAKARYFEAKYALDPAARVKDETEAALAARKERDELARIAADSRKIFDETIRRAS